MKTLLTPPDVAAKLGVSPQLVNRWIREGRIRVAITTPQGTRLIEPKDAKRPKPRKRGRPPKQ